jgi:hypothetical protein
MFRIFRHRKTNSLFEKLQDTVIKVEGRIHSLSKCNTLFRPFTIYRRPEPQGIPESVLYHHLEDTCRSVTYALRDAGAQ